MLRINKSGAMPWVSIRCSSHRTSGHRDAASDPDKEGGEEEEVAVGEAAAKAAAAETDNEENEDEGEVAPAIPGVASPLPLLPPVSPVPVPVVPALLLPVKHCMATVKSLKSGFKPLACMVTNRPRARSQD